MAKGEFQCVSIDATVRGTMQLHGQENYRADRTEREQQAVPLEESADRILTVRGKTGAVLLMDTIMSESAENVGRALREGLPRTALRQMEHIACDNPSRELFCVLKRMCPSMESLTLDPTHLVMKYEETQWGRRTTGSGWLRLVMDKFTRILPGEHAARFGEIWNGDGDFEAWVPNLLSNWIVFYTLVKGGGRGQQDPQETTLARTGRGPGTNWTLTGHLPRSLAGHLCGLGVR